MKKERINIILLAGNGTNRLVARTFNATHVTQITHDTVAKLIRKFKRTGSVADASRSRSQKTAKDKVLAAMASRQIKEIRCLSEQMGISQSNVMCNFLANKWRLYKLKMLRRAFRRRIAMPFVLRLFFSPILVEKLGKAFMDVPKYILRQGSKSQNSTHPYSSSSHSGEFEFHFYPRPEVPM
ncbi:hypothetical protein AVEN_155706-1 [Araneus ventricosus]|uniref:DUF4817 domain-containing protein n=1 Tax=Araneus ventricosus TaxID=182803 RepID=A0A4Y2HX92_ARAVE|nr:hypothetical protein AVEN_155706-1 [Araneus ventricosus]